VSDINIIVEPSVTNVVIEAQPAIDVVVEPTTIPITVTQEVINIVVEPQVIEVTVNPQVITEVVLNVGPKGERGDRGEIGIQGERGEAGTDAAVTKTNVEAVLTGLITTHSHVIILADPDTNIRYQMGITIDPDSLGPVTTWTELP
jgi:hypothetical protein